MVISLSPLRDRKEDIPELARHFLSICSQHALAHPKDFTQEAMDRLVSYDWPGNVRELRNIVERAAYQATGHLILEDAFARNGLASKPILSSFPSSLEELERAYLIRVLHAHGGVVKEAAEALGMPKSTLYYKISKLNIQLGHQE